MIFDSDNSRTHANGRSHRERTTERKRQRGEIACAECRRLKLKCDRKIPCSSCTRRQCQSICPNGVLATTQSTRLEKLQRNVTVMSRRIRLLENALRVDHAALSNDPHPLLSDELLEIKKGYLINDEQSSQADQDDLQYQSEDNDNISDSPGLLSINEGEARFVGASGSEQLILMTEAKDDSLELDHAGILGSASFSMNISEAASTWPLTPPLSTASNLQTQIETQLPPYQKAKALCDAFFNTFCWWVRPVTHEQLYDELLPMVYNRFGQDSDLSGIQEGLYNRQADLHDLALLFIIFACGAHADTSLPFHNEDTKRYRQLSRASLALKSIFDTASLSAVQAVTLMAQFDVLLGKDNALESSWRLMCLALSLAMSIGLHRDPARWDLDSKIVNRRRQAFWSVYLIALWKTLSCGKPISISAETIDCEFPEDMEAIKTSDGSTLPSNWRLIHTFTKDILVALADRVCAARPPKYTDILEIDRRVTEHETYARNVMNEYVGLMSRDQLKSLDRQTQMKLNSQTLMESLAMMYIHRNSFARALLDHPRNPLESSFAKSFIACFGCATNILKLTRENFRRDRDMTLRCWPIWEHSIAATIIVGFVATQRAGTNEASTALREVDLAIGVFQDAIAHPFVKHALPILLRVQEKAVRAANPQSLSDLSPRVSVMNDEFDLQIFGGMTRVIVENKSPKNSPEPPNLPEPSTSRRSSPHLTPPDRNLSSVAQTLAPIQQQPMDDTSWGPLNTNGRSMSFADSTQPFTSIANLAPLPRAFTTDPTTSYRVPLSSQATQHSVLIDGPAPLPNFSFTPPPPPQQAAPIGLHHPFTSHPPQLTEWTSSFPTFANYQGGVMTTEAMVTHPGFSHAAEQANDINFAALLPSYGLASSAIGSPGACDGRRSITQAVVASSLPFISDQQHNY